ncbi:hypothetical protein B0H16DRAFT_1578073, partial [Mycena metata]
RAFQWPALRTLGANASAPTMPMRSRRCKHAVPRSALKSLPNARHPLRAKCRTTQPPRRRPRTTPRLHSPCLCGDLPHPLPHPLRPPLRHPPPPNPPRLASITPCGATVAPAAAWALVVKFRWSKWMPKYGNHFVTAQGEPVDEATFNNAMVNLCSVDLVYYRVKFVEQGKTPGFLDAYLTEDEEPQEEERCGY